MQTTKIHIPVLCGLLLLAACQRPPGETAVVGEASWQGSLEEAATLTVELVPVSRAADRPTLSSTQALTPESRSAEFRLPFDPTLLGSRYRFTARIDHGAGLLLGEHDEALELRGEGHRLRVELAPAE